MFKRSLLAFAILLLVSWAAYSWAEGSQEGRAVIGNATKALGSENLRTLEFSGSGYDFAIGQAPNPSAPWPKFNDKTYTRMLNLEAPASRMQRVRTQAENPPHGGGQQPIVGEQNQTQIVAPGSTAAAALPDELMMLTPFSFLRSAAAASDLSVKSRSMGGKKYTVLTFTALNKAPASGYLNGENMLERVETKIDNTVLGDIPFETIFADYKDARWTTPEADFVEDTGKVHPRESEEAKFLSSIYDLGDGEINFPGCHPVLKSIGYKGWICVDLDTARKGPRASYERCGAYVVNKLESIYV